MCATFVHDLCEGTLGNAPDLIIEGDKDATYTGVSVHLEYVMTELVSVSSDSLSRRTTYCGALLLCRLS